MEESGYKNDLKVLSEIQDKMFYTRSILPAIMGELFDFGLGGRPQQKHCNSMQKHTNTYHL